MKKAIQITIVVFIVFIMSIFCMSAELEISGGGVLHSANGRYVFGQISSFATGRYMLDTQTGRLWQFVVDKENNPSLQTIPYDTPDGKLSIYPESTQSPRRLK